VRGVILTGAGEKAFSAGADITELVRIEGVIVSQIIVLFDFIEEARAKGEPLEQALLTRVSTAPVRRRTASPLACSTADDHGCYAIFGVFPQ
jgi:enoyl-CoA hydratase/carnithine racemase